MSATGRRMLLLIFPILLTALMPAGCSSRPAKSSSARSLPPPPASSAAAETNTSVGSFSGENAVYTDRQFEFTITLPNSWKGFTTFRKDWNGVDGSGKIAATGPAVVIRNPKWTAQTPYQDISLFIFTPDQVGSLKRGEFSVPSFSGGTLSAQSGFLLFVDSKKHIFLSPPFDEDTRLPGFAEVKNILSSGTVLTPVGDNRLPVSNADSVPEPVVAPPESGSVTSAAGGSILYTNRKYGFSFTLPEDWNGFRIESDEWRGTVIGDDGERTVETGPLLSLRNPRWTEKKPTQDIPIMIFTLVQWNALKEGKYSVGAAPVDPTELNRSAKYVFALPARYNFAFPEDWKEVEKILQGKPLQPTEMR